MEIKENKEIPFLDFEEPLENLYEQLGKLEEIREMEDIDVEDSIQALEMKIAMTKKEIYNNLTGWQRVQLSRHPNRLYTLDYIKGFVDDFVELHGDRKYSDDKAIIGGLGTIGGHKVMVIGHQKGSNTKMRQYRNFGMGNPEGYRKAERLMKLAEKFSIPVICLIDTPGAFPGIEAEERGQAEAIGRNLFVMASLRTPILCYIIGEGASGGAIGFGLGDKVFMLENTWYSVISPESCSSILWRSWDYKENAAEQLKLTADHMFSFNLIDGIVPEPLGGVHQDPEESKKILKKHLMRHLRQLKQIPVARLVSERRKKYRHMGEYDSLKKKKDVNDVINSDKPKNGL